MPQSLTGVPRKTKIAVLVFVLGCLLSTVRIARDAPTPIHPLPDDIAKRSDQRFAALRASLQPGGVVGYVGEPGNAAIGDYYLTQYALTPLVVEYSPNHPLVVGNFPASVPPGFPGNLELVKDFGDGVLLLGNKDANKNANRNAHKGAN